MKAKHLFATVAITLSLLPLSGIPRQDKGVLDPEDSNEARLNRLLPPERIMDAVGVARGMVLAEIGAGRGRFVVHLSVRVGEKGKVYAEDIDAEDLRHLENRCEKWGLDNIETILGDLTDPKLPETEMDLILVVSSYHHFSDPVALIRKSQSALKEGGRLAIAEWLPWNDGDREGTKPEDVEAQMETAGYRLIGKERLDVAKPLIVYLFRPFEERCVDH